MKRWMIDLLCAASLLLFLCAIVLWVDLGRRRIGLSFSPTDHLQLAALPVEKVLVLRVASIPWPISPRGFEIQRRNLSIGRDPLDGSDVGITASAGRPSSDWHWELAGLYYRHLIYPYTSRSRGGAPYHWMDREVWIPYWLLAILFAVSPAWWLIVTRRRRIQKQRRLNGQCIRCGYDLRATPDRCPECGAEPVVAKT
jgi:hypothetical protein